MGVGLSQVYSLIALHAVCLRKCAMVSTNFFIVACQDHGFAAREFGSKHPVEAFAIGAVQGGIGLIKENQRAVIGKDRTKLGELQLRPCEVKGVRVGVVWCIRPPLPYRGMNHLVRRVMQSKSRLMMLSTPRRSVVLPLPLAPRNHSTPPLRGARCIGPTRNCGVAF